MAKKKKRVGISRLVSPLYAERLKCPRNNYVMVYLNDDEMEQLQKWAAGVPLARTLRQLAFGERKRSPARKVNAR